MFSDIAKNGITYFKRYKSLYTIMLSIETICLLATISAIIYGWCRYTYGYWERQGIPYMKPLPLLGNTKVMFTQSKNFLLYLSDIYADPKMSNEAAVGIYLLNRPALLLRDPELIKSVMIKDFNKFSDRTSGSDPHGDALAANNLFLMNNPKWKELRTKFTPIYTTAKIKQMYPHMREIGTELEDHLNQYGKSFVTEIKEISALFTTDLIATTAFGVRANSLKNPNGEFRTLGRKFFEFTLKRAITFLIAFFFPQWAPTLKIKMFSPEFSTFLRTTIDHVMTEREKSNVARNDLIDVLVEMKKELAARGEYDDEARDMLVAQTGVFFLAGFETSSSATTFALYEMAKNQDLQERLRNEICDALVAENGKLSYDTLINLPYLSMVIDETLRMYPVLPSLDRAHKPAEGDQPFDLRPFYNYTLPKDMPIYIPAYGLQHDEKFWPNPEIFDPERFSPENKRKNEPLAYQAFGTGPRNCVGNRIGLLQTKLALAHFLKNHCVKVCDKTPMKVKFDPLSIGLQNKGGMYLNIENDELYNRKAKKLEKK